MSKKIEIKQGQKKRRKQRAIKKSTRKRRKDNKTLNHTKKVKKGEKRKKNYDKKAIKEKEIKIKILTRELLIFTLSYLMLSPWLYFNHSNL
jgi:hypothetical protein